MLAPALRDGPWRDDSILPTRRSFPADLRDGQEWVIELDRRLHLRIELSTPNDEIMIGALDEDGENVPLYTVSGEYYSASTWQSIPGGRSQILAVSDSARMLALYDGNEIVARLPINLVPNIVNEIRW